ncbi:apoptosis regulator BAX isoform X2 [Falco cherrug]|uniref:apoptosis regulator BAX isoform X2 n=1 Tax=Falco cherrug TaxID=345164 RepID=UPI002478F5E5|nr:apoptosis regulator BAX isoform X2 [Falco cherrug]
MEGQEGGGLLEIPWETGAKSISCIVRIGGAVLRGLVGALAGRPPLPTLAEVSEQLFHDGINWGRVVVFFYVTYRVVRQALWGDHPLRTILDWAVSFLQRHLSTWIQHQGGWGSILSYSPPQPSQNPRAGGGP